MFDSLLNVVLLVMLVLGFVLSVWYGSRFHIPVVKDIAPRYRTLRGSLLVYCIVFPLAVVLEIERRDGSLFHRLIWPGCIAFAFGINLVQFLRTREKYLTLPESARPQAQAPIFFWQAVFILLPVTVMAAFGFWAILHQRRMVEQDAQARAADIIRSLPDDFGRIAASGLSQYDADQCGWLHYMDAVARWPGDGLRVATLGDTNELNIISNNMAVLSAAFPGWPDRIQPLTAFMLDTNGHPAWQQSFPPRPPEWLSLMTADQRAAWDAFQSADLTGKPASNLVELASAFRVTGPPPAARACADFLVLSSRLRETPATNAVKRLLNFAGRNYDVISDSGLPLRSLALAEALRRSRECGPSADLWGALHSEATEAGALAPRLLDEAAALAARDPELSKSSAALKTLLAESQLRRELAQALAESGYSTGIMVTSRWINGPDGRWFCSVQPEEISSETIVSNRPITWTDTQPQINCYAGAVVGRSLADALVRAKVSLPDYFSIACELKGEPVILPVPWNKSTNSMSLGDLLAEGTWPLTLPAIMRNTRADGTTTDIPFESVPSHPQLTLQIHLSDRHRLYAQQQELQLIFGSLIALSLLSAITGFVAARRSFQRQLQLNEQKSNFVSSVSHELRAPIASVRLMAENLERGKVPEPARQGEYFRYIVQECRRLSSLIENVLDFSRIEQGRKQYEFEPTNLAALAETTVKLMEPYAAEKGVLLKLETFNLQPSTPNIELNVDGRAIQQALVNLIDNAVKHSPKGETVLVGIENGAAGMVGLYVADQGPGIPPAEHEKIFERFYRLGSELRRETQGVGIGLSVVKHIVEAHDGRVCVQSAMGHGSRFTIEFPAK